MFRFSIALLVLVGALDQSVIAQTSPTGKADSLNVLFIGNSYTARHNLVQVVKAMAEAGNPDLEFNPTAVIYGGRTLADHWRLETQNVVNRYSLSLDEQTATIDRLEQALKNNSEDRHAKTALSRHRGYLAEMKSKTFPRSKWDLVILQSYRDDLGGPTSLYSRYAPKFAEIAKAQGARVLLYETTPTTQNAAPLTSAPDAQPVLKKARQIGALADQLNALVAPMSFVAHQCQKQRPDLTLRFVNDAHLNQTLAYLTACTMYAAIFDKSPYGLPVDSVTDTRYWKNDKTTNKDRDGKPIRKVFSQQDREDLQRIAWESFQEFKKFRSSPVPGGQ